MSDRPARPSFRRSRATVLTLWALCACTGRAGTPHPANSSGVSSAEQSAGGSASRPIAGVVEGPVGAPADAELEQLRGALSRGDSAALEFLGVTLGRGGVTEIDGSPAPDERVARVDLPVRDARSAAMVLRTTCGNLWLVGLLREGTRWTRGAGRPLVPPVQPGRCVRTTAVVQPLAVRGDPARELAVGVRWEDATGDEVHGPSLWIAGLDPRDGVTLLLEQAPFGATDDRTGASTEGSLAVIDELPPPRPVFVEIRPAGRGTESGVPGVRIVRRYELRGVRIELADEQRSTIASP